MAWPCGRLSGTEFKNEAESGLMFVHTFHVSSQFNHAELSPAPTTLGGNVGLHVVL